MYIKKYKGYRVIRYSWWRFWDIDDLEFSLSSKYMDAYEEETRELKSWVVEDVREKLEVLLHSVGFFNSDLRCRCSLCKPNLNHVTSFIIPKRGHNMLNKLVSKAKKLSVRIHTKEYGQFYTDFLNFYIIDGVIYFDSDVSIKREKLLNRLGI